VWTNPALMEAKVSGGMVTVIAADPVFPSEVALIVALPSLTPVTSPVSETVATASALDDQAISRSVKTVPAASWVTASS
jgi:hypothetical protein